MSNNKIKVTPLINEEANSNALEIQKIRALIIRFFGAATSEHISHNMVAGLVNYYTTPFQIYLSQKDKRVKELEQENESLIATVNTNGLNVAQQIKFRVNAVIDEYVNAFSTEPKQTDEERVMAVLNGDWQQIHDIEELIATMNYGSCYVTLEGMCDDFNSKIERRIVGNGTFEYRLKQQEPTASPEPKQVSTDNLLACDGRKFEATIEGNATTGEVVVFENMVYFATDTCDGNWNITDKRGYKFLWKFSKEWASEVTDFQLLPIEETKGEDNEDIIRCNSCGYLHYHSKRISVANKNEGYRFNSIVCPKCHGEGYSNLTLMAKDGALDWKGAEATSQPAMTQKLRDAIDNGNTLATDVVFASNEVEDSLCKALQAIFEASKEVPTIRAITPQEVAVLEVAEKWLETNGENRFLVAKIEAYQKSKP